MKIHEVTNKQNKGKDEDGRNFTLVGGFNPCGLISNVHQVAHLPRTKWTNSPPQKKKNHKKNMKLQSISTGLPFEHPLLVSLYHLSKTIRPDIIHLSGALLWALRLLCHALQGFTLLNFFLSGVNGQCFPCFCWLKIMFEWPVYTCIYVQICI